MRHVRLAALAAVMVLAASSATAADRIRIAVQRTGTLAWELDVIRTHGLDRKANLQIETIELASTEAGKIALKGGSADLMLSDWLWVARERSLGDHLVFYPSSSTLGAVMVPADSDIASIADLKGREARHRRRSARQELAPPPGARTPLGTRPAAASDDHLRRATTALAEGAPGRTGRDAHLLELLRRPRRQRLQARDRGRRCDAPARRQGGGGDCRLHLRRPLGRQEQVGASTASSRPRARQRRFSPPPMPNGSGLRPASGCTMRPRSRSFASATAKASSAARSPKRRPTRARSIAVLAEVGGSRPRRSGARARPSARSTDRTGVRTWHCGSSRSRC